MPATMLEWSRPAQGEARRQLRYNGRMDVDGVRIVCPACGRRLVVMPRIEYIACRNCGSEYTVQRKGNTIGLEAFVPEQVELSRQIADVERSQGEGCSNVFFWILLVTGVLFCGSRLPQPRPIPDERPLRPRLGDLSDHPRGGCGRAPPSLNTQREQRLRLEAKRQKLYEQMGGGEDGGEAGR